MRQYCVRWPLLVLPIFALTAQATILGTASSFAVLGGSTVTNTNVSNVNGNLGVWPGSAVTGFPPGIVANGTIHLGDAVAQQAQSDLNTAFNLVAGLPFTSNLTGQDLGGLILLPGVYHFDSSAQLTGALTLDGQGSNTAAWYFQIGSTLTTASASSVQVINGGPNNALYWQVGSSATLGTGTSFAGNILALTSITLNTTANITCGRALAENGAVTMDTNVVSIGCAPGSAGSLGAFDDDTSVSAVPEPGSIVLLTSVVGLLCFSGKLRQRLKL